MKPPMRQALSRGVRFCCPHCGEGRVFSSFFRLRDACPECGLSFYPESGYYTGAMYLNYGLSAAIFLLFFIPSLFLPEFTRLSYETKSILWVTFGALLCLGMARPSYSLWLAIDYWISPWKPEEPEGGHRKDENIIEIPLVSLTIRADGSQPRRGTPHDSEN